MKENHAPLGPEYLWDLQISRSTNITRVANIQVLALNVPEICKKQVVCASEAPNILDLRLIGDKCSQIYKCFVLCRPWPEYPWYSLIYRWFVLQRPQISRRFMNIWREALNISKISRRFMLHRPQISRTFMNIQWIHEYQRNSQIYRQVVLLMSQISRRFEIFQEI